VAHFTLQVAANGPIITAYVSVSAARHAALVAAGQQIPTPVRIQALLDTGASHTAVDPTLTALNLTPTGTALVNTPTTGATPQAVDQYDVGMFIPSPNGDPLFNQTLPVTASELVAGQGFHALIGRDILSQCVFVYNGSGFFTLSY
jgi:hypothetical protein